MNLKRIFKKVVMSPADRRSEEIHYALDMGDPEKALRILNGKGKINPDYIVGGSSLLYKSLILNDQPAIFELLLEKGADPSPHIIRDHDRLSALDITCKNGSAAVYLKKDLVIEYPLIRKKKREP